MRNLRRDRSRVRRLTFLSVLAYIIMVTVNFLANYLPIRVATGEISEKYSNLFTPAGYTFSIWIFIYFMLALFLILIIKGVITDRGKAVRVVQRTGTLFILSCFINTFWIFAWHYDFILLSFVLILTLLLVIRSIYLRMKKSIMRPGFYLFPFRIYFGWISVAALANLKVLSVAREWKGVDSYTWFFLLLAAAVAAGIYIIVKHDDSFYGLVIIWALLGIFVARWQEVGSMNLSAAGSLAAVFVLLIVILVNFRKDRSYI